MSGRDTRPAYITRDAFSFRRANTAYFSMSNHRRRRRPATRILFQPSHPQMSLWTVTRRHYASEVKMAAVETIHRRTTGHITSTDAFLAFFSTLLSLVPTPIVTSSIILTPALLCSLGRKIVIRKWFMSWIFVHLPFSDPVVLYFHTSSSQHISLSNASYSRLLKNFSVNSFQQHRYCAQQEVFSNQWHITLRLFI